MNPSDDAVKRVIEQYSKNWSNIEKHLKQLNEFAHQVQKIQTQLPKTNFVNALQELKIKLGTAFLSSKANPSKF